MNKIHFNARFSENTMNIIEKRCQFDDYKSKSEFIEEAIEFYNSYLNSMESTKFLETVIDNAIKKHIEDAGNHIAKTYFKQAVELDMMMHIVAATNDVDEITLNKLRGMCVQEVKATIGRIDFDNAVRTQKG